MFRFIFFLLFLLTNSRSIASALDLPRFYYRGETFLHAFRVCVRPMQTTKSKQQKKQNSIIITIIGRTKLTAREMAEIEFTAVGYASNFIICFVFASAFAHLRPHSVHNMDRRQISFIFFRLYVSFDFVVVASDRHSSCHFEYKKIKSINKRTDIWYIARRASMCSASIFYRKNVSKIVDDTIHPTDRPMIYKMVMHIWFNERRARCTHVALNKTIR